MPKIVQLKRYLLIKLNGKIECVRTGRDFIFPFPDVRNSAIPATAAFAPTSASTSCAVTAARASLTPPCIVVPSLHFVMNHAAEVTPATTKLNTLATVTDRVLLAPR